nr:hypothetical protein [Pirellula staleyi]
MSHFKNGNLPGFQPKIESDERQITWSARQGIDLVATRGVVVDDDTVDEGNVPSSTLRGGLVMAISSSTGFAVPYQPNGVDGAQIAVGVLENPLPMEVDGQPTQRFTQLIVQGLVRAAELPNLDERAKQQLAGRIQFDNLEVHPGVLMHPRGVVRAAGNQTLTSAQTGLLFLMSGASTITLPAAANGLAYRIAQTTDNDLTIVGSGNMIHRGYSNASTVSFTAGANKIGSQVLVEGVFVDSVNVKWLVTNLGGTTAAVAA